MRHHPHLIRATLLSVILAFALSISSCDKESNYIDTRSGQGYLLVRTGGMDIDLTPMSTRKSTSADSAGVSRISVYLFDNTGTTIVDSCHQEKDTPASYTSAFGDYGATLEAGNYKLVVLGYKSSQPTVVLSPTAALFPEGVIRDCFCFVGDVAVRGSDTIVLNAELQRAVARLQLVHPAAPTDVDSIEITIANGGRRLNPTTGLATASEPIRFCSANTSAGTKTMYTLLTADSLTTEVVIRAKQGATTAFTKRLTPVPLMRNHTTVLTGNPFTAEGAGTFRFNTTYGTEIQVNF